MDIGGRLDLGLTGVSAAGGCCGGGSCGTSHPGADTTLAESAPGAQTVLVEGMTCAHCVASVTEELSALVEVQRVSVELRVGGASRVTIRASSPLAEGRIRSAVEEAGYAVAGS